MKCDQTIPLRFVVEYSVVKKKSYLKSILLKTVLADNIQ